MQHNNQIQLSLGPVNIVINIFLPEDDRTTETYSSEVFSYLQFELAIGIFILIADSNE
jgi:hypothetical protein